MVQGLGKITAGASGLATGTNIGGMYKEPQNVFDLKEMNASEQSKYGAAQKSEMEGGELERKTLEDTIKMWENAGLNPKLMQDMMRTYLNPAGYTAQSQLTREEKKRIEEDAALALGYKPEGKKVQDASKNPKFNFEKYGQSTLEIKKQLAMQAPYLLTQPTPEKFAEALAATLSPIGPKEGSRSGGIGDVDAILARYKAIKQIKNLTDKDTRALMLKEVTELAKGDFTSSFYGVLNGAKVAQQYGLPITDITYKDPSAGIVSLNNLVDRNTPDPTIEPEPQPAPAQTQQPKTKQGAPVKGKTTGPKTSAPAATEQAPKTTEQKIRMKAPDGTILEDTRVNLDNLIKAGIKLVPVK
jgi:hypothetical protein